MEQEHFIGLMEEFTSDHGKMVNSMGKDNIKVRRVISEKGFGRMDSE
jgi:hypothetical protein